MLQKKVCMLGSFAVGKTSLVRRFVESIYSDTYHTTVGVKVDKKIVKVADQDLTMVLWDIYGSDEFQDLKLSYLRGMSGFLLVADGTRRATLDAALNIQQKVEQSQGAVPFVFLINKQDLRGEWEIDTAAESSLAGRGWSVLHTSAKTGENVDAAFLQLGGAMLSRSSAP